MTTGASPRRSRAGRFILTIPTPAAADGLQRAPPLSFARGFHGTCLHWHRHDASLKPNVEAHETVLREQETTARDGTTPLADTDRDDRTGWNAQAGRAQHMRQAGDRFDQGAHARSAGGPSGAGPSGLAEQQGAAGRQREFFSDQIDRPHFDALASNYLASDPTQPWVPAISAMPVPATPTPAPVAPTGDVPPDILSPVTPQKVGATVTCTSKTAKSSAPSRSGTWGNSPRGMTMHM